VEDQQFDPDDMTGQSPDDDAAAEAATGSVGTQPAEPGCAETYCAATGTAEPHNAGAGRPVQAAAGAAGVVEVARVQPEVRWRGRVSELVGGAYGP
jgi:hypothetical protein